MTRYRFETKNRHQVLTRATTGQSHRTLLEQRFPHVLAAIQAMWGYPELDTYFHKLAMDDRGGRRQGFPPEAWEEIYLLWSVHQTIVPKSLSATSPGVSCV